ncbi:MAG: hypothetical protein R8G60_12265 [Roseovarius pacificus]|nr:hypothetical protein [Roseovarius pacificus]
MRWLWILVPFILISCGRPLTPTETAFATRIHGDSLNTDRIRVVNGALIGKVTYPRQKRPRLTCRERILPEPTTPTVTVAPAAVVVHNKVFFSKDWYEPDYMPQYPAFMSLVHAMIFAHEMTHVWQWQNRRQTGYSPLQAMREHRVSDDPYLFDISTRSDLLDYGYEQQASIVEEYVCCATLDPDAPRTERLRAMLSDAFPLGDLPEPNTVLLPWKGVQLKGICRI